ncbi:hypothetical protein J6590_047864 [Homalodisca vitripennis]|nr:hypothetical protein J6590_047864 [Homalodisca vitripennis]
MFTTSGCVIPSRHTTSEVRRGAAKMECEIGYDASLQHCQNTLTAASSLSRSQQPIVTRSITALNASYECWANIMMGLCKSAHGQYIQAFSIMELSN